MYREGEGISGVKDKLSSFSNVIQLTKPARRRRRRMIRSRRRKE